MKSNTVAIGALAAVLLPAGVLAADYHHVHIAAPSPLEAVRWYGDHLGCEPIAERRNATNCQGVEVVFAAQTVLGGTQGTGVDHIGFSYPDLEAKMAELEAVGVGGSGVRLQRFDDGELFRDVPGRFRARFIFDPWGTRIELVEDPERLGFHHVHMSAADPEATLDWYRDVLDGEPARLKGRFDGLLFNNDIWLLVSRHAEGRPAPTAGRTLDHVAFMVPDLDTLAAELDARGIEFEQPPAVPEDGRSNAKRAYLLGPDGVRLALVETGWAGVLADLTTGVAEPIAALERYVVPRTPWGEPDLQGIWTGDAAHGIPLERPLDAAEIENVSPEEAAARRERGTLNSIWGYEREWRDTTLGYAKDAPLTQVAMIVDPPNGRLPLFTPHGEALAAAAANEEPGVPAGPEDLSSWVRCITRGLPGLMMPGVYNNGLQIVQSPGFVAIQKEMIHETRIIPTDGRARSGEDIRQWLGESTGWWEGDTLVVEVRNFNGRVPYRGAGENMTLTERYTRVAPNLLQYVFTVDDPTIWTQPWTAVFPFVRDDDQYELVEYACHEGNYGMTNILSGARATERAAEQAQP